MIDLFLNSYFLKRQRVPFTLVLPRIASQVCLQRGICIESNANYMWYVSIYCSNSLWYILAEKFRLMLIQFYF